MVQNNFLISTNIGVVAMQRNAQVFDFFQFDEFEFFRHASHLLIKPYSLLKRAG